MPGRNRYPVLGGHVETELAEWVRAEAKRRGTTVTALLTEALRNLRTYLDADPRIPPDAPPPWF
jgi:hypothetical protein